MTRQNDNMDEQRYFTIQRDVDLVKQNATMLEKKMDSIVSRQERHEEKITECIEKLTNIVVSVDKKIDVSLAQSLSRSSVWDKIWQIGPFILVALIGGVYKYESDKDKQLEDVENKIVQTPINSSPPVTIYQKR